jgi:putative ABC transport system ATP-binding protein
MHCVAGLDTLTSGQVYIGDTDLSTLNDRQLTVLRRAARRLHLPSLQPRADADRDREHHAAVDARRRKPDREWLQSVIDTVGLGSREAPPIGAVRRPAAARRVARALASRPDIIFADEPTGNLDSQTGAEILSFMRAVREMGQTIVMVTHDPVAAAYSTGPCSWPTGKSSTT